MHTILKPFVDKVCQSMNRNTVLTLDDLAVEFNTAGNNETIRYETSFADNSGLLKENIDIFDNLTEVVTTTPRSKVYRIFGKPFTHKPGSIVKRETKLSVRQLNGRFPRVFLSVDDPVMRAYLAGFKNQVRDLVLQTGCQAYGFDFLGIPNGFEREIESFVQATLILKEVNVRYVPLGVTSKFNYTPEYDIIGPGYIAPGHVSIGRKGDGWIETTYFSNKVKTPMPIEELAKQVSRHWLKD